MDSSLIISSTTVAGKKAAKAISNINPEKNNSVLKTFAQKVNALTTNTYVDATRINKQSVNEPDQSGGNVTLTVNTDNATTVVIDSVTDIENGKRIIFDPEGSYIDVTYSVG